MFKKKTLTNQLLDSGLIIWSLFFLIIVLLEQKNRLAALESLKSDLLTNNVPYSDLRKLWKILFFCENLLILFFLCSFFSKALWQADKPIIQNELSDNIAGLIVFLAKNDSPFEFLKAGLNILSKEWSKIDYYRLNKFLYLVTSLLRASFEALKCQKWAYKVA